MASSTFPAANCNENISRIVYVVDDDEHMRAALTRLMRSIGIEARAFASTEDFLASDYPPIPSCLVLDVRLRGQSGLALQEMLTQDQRLHMPIIFITGYGDIAMSVKAMKAGAIDFFTKPFRDQDLIDSVFAALGRDERRLASDRALRSIKTAWNSLTPREREVLQHVATGLSNKQIAARMGIAEITVKIHRGQAMRKMNARSVAQVVCDMQRIKSVGV